MEEMGFMRWKPNGLSVVRSPFSIHWDMDIMKSHMKKHSWWILDIMRSLSRSKRATHSFTAILKLENTFLTLLYLEKWWWMPKPLIASLITKSDEC